MLRATGHARMVTNGGSDNVRQTTSGNFGLRAAPMLWYPLFPAAREIRGGTVIVSRCDQYVSYYNAQGQRDALRAAGQATYGKFVLTMRAWPVARSIFDAPCFMLICEGSERADNKLDKQVCAHVTVISSSSHFAHGKRRPY